MADVLWRLPLNLCLCLCLFVQASRAGGGSAGDLSEQLIKQLCEGLSHSAGGGGGPTQVRSAAAQGGSAGAAGKSVEAAVRHDLQRLKVGAPGGGRRMGRE